MNAKTEFAEAAITFLAVLILAAGIFLYPLLVLASKQLQRINEAKEGEQK